MARVRFPARARYFTLLHSVQTGYDAHPAYYVRGTEGAFLWGVERQGHEADDSPPSGTEVKNGGTILLLPPTFWGLGA
jgi:hypothetical protein